MTPDEFDAKMRVFETASDICVLPEMYMVARLDAGIDLDGQNVLVAQAAVAHHGPDRANPLGTPVAIVADAVPHHPAFGSQGVGV